MDGEKGDFMSDAVETPNTPSPESSETPVVEESEVVETSGEEVENAEDSSDPSSEPKAEKKPNKKKIKYKVDGEEIEEELDLDNEEELVKRSSLAKAAHKRMEEAAQMRKDFEQFLTVFKQDPAQVMQALGLNVDDFAEKYLDSKLQELQKTPEQKKQEQLEKELEKYKKEAEAAKKAQEEAMFAKMQAQVAKEIEDDITDALKSTPDLPRSPYVVKRIAEAMMIAFEKGHTGVKVKDVLPIVKKQIQSEWQDMFGQLPEDILEQVVGKPNIERLRKNRIKQAKQQVTQAAKVTPTGQSETKKQEKEDAQQKIKARDFFKNLGRV